MSSPSVRLVVSARLYVQYNLAARYLSIGTLPECNRIMGGWLLPNGSLGTFPKVTDCVSGT